MSEQYLTILQESLQQKSAVLDEILRISQHQSDILKKEPISFEEFDRCVDDKDLCIDQLNKLDEGFEALYARVEADLKDNREKHQAWIRETQKLITEVMDKSVTIQALEARNKQAVEEIFRRERRDFSQGKRSVKAAMNYYRNMSKTSVVPPQYMDKKK